MVPPSSQDEALSRYSVSGEVPREELEVEAVLGTLDAPPQSSPASRSPWRGLNLHHFLRLLDFAGQGSLLLHEPFRKMILQFLPNLRADQIPRSDGNRGMGLRRPVPLGKIGGDLAKDLLRFFNQRG